MRRPTSSRFAARRSAPFNSASFSRARRADRARASTTPTRPTGSSPTSSRRRTCGRACITSAVTPHWLGQSDSLCYDWKDHTGSHLLPRRADDEDEEAAVRPGEARVAALGSEPSRARSAEPAVQHADVLEGSQDVHVQRRQLAVGMGRRDGDAQAPRTGERRRWRRAGAVVAAVVAAAVAAAVQTAAPPDTVNTCGGGGGGRAGGGGGGGGGFGGGRGGDFRNYSPDSSMFAFAREHNLYLVKVATKDTVQLTHDGVKNYSFGARDTLQERQQQELNTPAATAAGRSTAAGRRRRRAAAASIAIRAFARTSLVARLEGVRRHAHGPAQGRRAVSSSTTLANPRPTLMEYSYAMPGEENVGAGRAVRVQRRRHASSRR